MKDIDRRIGHNDINKPYHIFDWSTGTSGYILVKGTRFCGQVMITGRPNSAERKVTFNGELLGKIRKTYGNGEDGWRIIGSEDKGDQWLPCTEAAAVRLAKRHFEGILCRTM